MKNINGSILSSGQAYDYTGIVHFIHQSNDLFMLRLFKTRFLSSKFYLLFYFNSMQYVLHRTIKLANCPIHDFVSKYDVNDDVDSKLRVSIKTFKIHHFYSIMRH